MNPLLLQFAGTIQVTGVPDVALPTGTVMPFAGSAAPANTLLCDGAAVSRTTFAPLFGVIGTTYGVGDGSTTFNVPDLRGRSAVGKDPTGVHMPINAPALGATGGEETHVLAVGEMPSHQHAVGLTVDSGIVPNNINTPGTTTTTMGWRSGAGVVGTASPADGKTSNIGGGTAHNNVHPFLSLNFVIQT